MYSAKPKLAQYVREDGTAAIYLQVIISKKTKRLDLNISWPVEHFDRLKGVCKPLTKGKDQQCRDNNLLIGQALAKANEIFTTYRLSRRSLSLDLFLRDYRSEFSKMCFLSFYEHRMLERLKTGEICHESVKQHTNTLHKLQKYSGGTLLFHEIDFKYAQGFDNFLKKQKLKQNTRWGHHKDFRTYLNQAIRNHYKFENPYNYFTISPGKGGWAALTFEERETLYQYYLERKPGTAERRVLQKFLFGCYSGLRWSDQSRLNKDLFKDGILRFKPWKNRRYDQQLEIPLLKRATDLVKDSLAENVCDTVFWPYTDQYANRKLKEIAVSAGIKKKLHHHVGRETFGTLFTESGGSVEELQWYFGHSKITTTMKYVHVTKERLLKRITKMNEE